MAGVFFGGVCICILELSFFKISTLTSTSYIFRGVCTVLAQISACYLVAIVITSVYLHLRIFAGLCCFCYSLNYFAKSTGIARVVFYIAH